jgi:thioredoxin reductase (NADPH)
LQALKFGVRFAISREVITAEQIDGIHKLTLAGGISVCSRSVVIASGAQYRKLSVKDYNRFENDGIYYAATAMESLLCREKEVIVVGGGNSAGQAAAFLSGIAKHVHHIVRGESLAKTMSQYLISRIESSSRVTLYTDSEIVKLEGGSSLESVAWTNRKSGEATVKPIGNVFVMIGAEPNSGWLFGTVKLDKKGFVCTGGADGFETTTFATSERAWDVRRRRCAVELGKACGVSRRGGLCGHLGRSSLPGGPPQQLRGRAELRTGGTAIGKRCDAKIVE